MFICVYIYFVECYSLITTSNRWLQHNLWISCRFKKNTFKYIIIDHKLNNVMIIKYLNNNIVYVYRYNVYQTIKRKCLLT